MQIIYQLFWVIAHLDGYLRQGIVVDTTGIPGSLYGKIHKKLGSYNRDRSIGDIQT